MFRFHKPPNIITLFHKASSPASIRVHTLLKQTAATASETATEDQASDHSAQTHPRTSEFELDVTEKLPTSDQLRIIIQSIGGQGIGNLISGAVGEKDAMRKLEESGDSFQRPVTVDWNNGKAVVGDNESEILKMLQGLPKK